MTLYKRLIPILLTLVFAAILVRGGHRVHMKHLRELGLTPACYRRVVATCHVSPVEIKTDRESFVEMVAKIAETERSLNRLEQKSEQQEKTLSDIKTNLQSLEEKISTQQELTTMKKQVKSNNAQISLVVEVVTNLQDRLVLPRNCQDVLDLGDKISGIRTVYPFTCCKFRSLTVFCDQATDGGGWTVFQRRNVLPQREDFFREWRDYQTGFGDLSGEFWLGLDNIHALVGATPNEIYVSLEDFEGDKKRAKYDTFSIEDADGKYRLHVRGYSGNAGDSLKTHDGKMFSTKDQDNDLYTSGNCAEDRRGAWWYNSCDTSSLNGFRYEKEMHESNTDGIVWDSFRGSTYSLEKTEMKVRPKWGK